MPSESIKVGKAATVNIKIGDGSTVACRVKVLGIATNPDLIRVKMIDGVDGAGLRKGDQTLLSRDRFD